ncbi:MAG: glycosyltransferase [bacterium]
MDSKKRILIAPLNWGLGHATRCIPIINELIAHNFEPIIASDGVALQLLKKEFPKILTYELPSYNITYSKKASQFKLKILSETPHILKTIKAEKNLTKKLVKDLNIKGIISDNRFGVRYKKIPSVFISHQLQVLSGNTTWFTTKIHQKIIQKYDVCWIPDVPNEPNLSGQLGHVKNANFPLEYLGALSRFNKNSEELTYDYMVLISGPEPQRSILVTKLSSELLGLDKKVLFVKGKMEKSKKVEQKENITFINFLTTQDLEKAINSSKVIISRSGYTTILDLAKLEKKAFFIPTPGQFEQEYLAKTVDTKGLVPFCTQDEFKLKQLDRVNKYVGLTALNYQPNFEELFSLF